MLRIWFAPCAGQLLSKRGEEVYVTNTGVCLGVPDSQAPAARLASRQRNEEQEAITLMRRLRAEGKTLREIADALQEQGIPGPTGGGWAEPPSHRILKRPTAP